MPLTIFHSPSRSEISSIPHLCTASNALPSVERNSLSAILPPLHPSATVLVSGRFLRLFRAFLPPSERLSSIPPLLSLFHSLVNIVENLFELSLFSTHIFNRLRHTRDIMADFRRCYVLASQRRSNNRCSPTWTILLADVRENGGEKE